MATILVIDDDESLLQMMELMLMRSGHRVLQAKSGQQGITLTRDNQPDMVIVDVMMPDMSGYAVTRTLREDPDTRHIPLMVLTALSGFEPLEDARKAGADDFLTKPVTRNDLDEKVFALLESGPINTPEPVEQEPDEPIIVEAPAPPPERDDYLKGGAPPVELDYGVISVLGVSAGVGATTLAINLTHDLLQRGRTCIVDLDPTGSQVAEQLQMYPPSTSWQALVDQSPQADKRRIGSALMIHRSGLAVMAAPTEPTQSYLSGEMLRRVYTVFAEGFRRTIVDLPDLFNPMSIATLRQSHHVVFVVGDSPSNLKIAPGRLAMLTEMELPGIIHVVINRTRPHGVTYEDVFQAVNYPIAADIPYESEQVEAQKAGQALVAFQPNSLYARAVNYLTRQL